MLQPKFDRLAVAIAGIKRAYDFGAEGGIAFQAEDDALSQLEAVLAAVANEQCRPSYLDAMAALEFAADMASTGRQIGPLVEHGDVAALIRIGLERLTRMGL